MWETKSGGASETCGVPGSDLVLDTPRELYHDVTPV